MLLHTFVPAAQSLGPPLVGLAEIGLTVTLFFIGAGLSAKVVLGAGVKPYILGILLWLVISAGSLFIILHTV